MSIFKVSVAKKESTEEYNEQFSGFASPAMDYMNSRLDLHHLLIYRPYATFYFQMEGSAMKLQGIDNGDLLIVDKSIAPKHDNIIVATWNGAFLVRRIRKTKDTTFLVGDTEVLNIRGKDVECWGTVTSCIKRFVK